MVISKAAAGRDDVGHLVYVAAVMIDGDDVFLVRTGDFPAVPLAEQAELTDDGWIVVSADAARFCFYNDCEPAAADAAAVRMRPTATACLGVPTGAEPWRTVPSTYLLCERDRAIHPEMQRWMSTRAGDVVVVDTDHSPFMSTPDEFVALLDGIAVG